MTEVYAANLGSNPYGSDERSSGANLGYVATFNTPSSTFDTIVLPKVYGGNVGDVIKVSVFKGSIPNDPNTDDDNSDTPAKLDVNDFVEEVTYSVTTAIAAGGIEIEFAFSTTFTQALLGDTYTVAVDQFDSAGTYVPFSPVLCTDRDGVYNYVNADDEGHQGGGVGGQGFFSTHGGAGNFYTINGSTIELLKGLGAPADKYTLDLGTGTFTIDGTADVYDPCPAWGTYSREAVTLNSTAYGTSRELTAPLTGALTASLT